VGSPTANDSVDGQGPDARRESQNEVDASKSSAHTLEQQIKAIFGPSEQEQRAERLAKAKKVLEVMQTKMVHELATTSSWSHCIEPTQQNRWLMHVSSSLYTSDLLLLIGQGWRRMMG
jgi:hypothetical protein